MKNDNTILYLILIWFLCIGILAKLSTINRKIDNSEKICNNIVIENIKED